MCTFQRKELAAIQLETYDYESLVTAAIHSHCKVQGLRDPLRVNLMIIINDFKKINVPIYTRRNILFFKYGLADGIRKLDPDCHRFLPIGNPFYIDRPISVYSTW